MSNGSNDVHECRIGIAIVEDGKYLVDVYRRMLEKKGINICFVAFDGKEALLKFIECSDPPHGVIMDYRLPTMNGIDTAREILKIDPGAKIIFLSADADVKEEAMKAGAYKFLKKPASIKDIIDAVQEIVPVQKPD